MEKEYLCKCGENPPSDEAHECPFACEIGDDYDFQCTCCDDCTYQCGMDV